MKGCVSHLDKGRFFGFVAAGSSLFGRFCAMNSMALRNFYRLETADDVTGVDFSDAGGGSGHDHGDGGWGGEAAGGWGLGGDDGGFCDRVDGFVLVGEDGYRLIFFFLW